MANATPVSGLRQRLRFGDQCLGFRILFQPINRFAQRVELGMDLFLFVQLLEYVSGLGDIGIVDRRLKGLHSPGGLAMNLGFAFFQEFTCFSEVGFGFENEAQLFGGLGVLSQL